MAYDLSQPLLGHVAERVLKLGAKRGVKLLCAENQVVHRLAASRQTQRLSRAS